MQKISFERIPLRPPYSGNWQILVISIVIDSDRTFLRAFQQKNLFTMKIECLTFN